MRAMWLLGVAAVMGLAMLMIGCDSRRSGTTVIKVADVHDGEYPTVKGLEEMGRIVAERTGGAMRFRIYHSGTLAAGETESLTQTRAGDIQINRVNAAPLEQLSPKMGVLALPYLFRDAEHQWKVLNGEIGDELLASLEGAGLAGIGWQDSGARSFYTKRPVERPADLRGMQIRVQDNDVSNEMVSLLGASPRDVKFNEVYTALQNNVIDAAENNAPSYWSKGHYQVARYLCLDEHNRLPEVIVANKAWWEKLTEEERTIFREAARESQAVQRRLWAEYEQQAFEAVRAAGCTISQPDREAFRAAMAPLYERYEGKYGDLVERIRAVR